MPNRWVEHVKEFARKNNISYGCALSDPNLKKGYIPTGDKKRKAEKLVMAVPDTSVKPKGIVIKQQEVVPLQQAFPDTAVKAKNITIKPRPLAATLGDDFALLRALLLRPFGIGTAMLLQKGLVKAKKEWIDGSLSPNAVLTILELTKSQQTHLKSDGEEGRSGALISVDKVEANRKEIDDLLAAITGQMGALELYHGGGMGSPHAFRMKLRGMGGIKEKRKVLANVAKWLEKVPSVAAVRELYDKEFSGQRAEMAASEAAAKTDARVSGATAWLGHPLTEIDYKDVVRSFKALIKKHAFKYNGQQALLKETEGNSAELISRVYKTLSGLADRSRWDPVLEDFKKSLLAKGFWVENVKRLPADLGAHIGSFLNLPKGVMKQLVARRTGKGYSGGVGRFGADEQQTGFKLPGRGPRHTQLVIHAPREPPSRTDWIFINDTALGPVNEAAYERVREMVDYFYDGSWNEMRADFLAWVRVIAEQEEGPPETEEEVRQITGVVRYAERKFNELAMLVRRMFGGSVVARSSLVKGNPHAMFGGMMTGGAPDRQAIRQFITRLRQGDRAAVATFNRAIQDEQYRAFVLALPDDVMVEVLQNLHPFSLDNFTTTYDEPAPRRRDDDDEPPPAPKKPRGGPSGTNRIFGAINFGTA
jgi:hypothetical protein